MAAIAQANPYHILARRIGYSVGLEDLVRRVTSLAAAYEEHHGLNYAAFQSLVVNDFGLKKSDDSVTHLGNFYGRLNLIELIGRHLEPLYQLDSLAITRQLFEGDATRSDLACRFILTQCILEADGDVFLNGLLALFKPEPFRALLESMCTEKSMRVRNVVRAPALFAKLNEVVTIRNQTNPERPTVGPESGSDRFGRRVVPLSSTRRRTPLTPEVSTAPAISEDYIHKATQTRKRWAEDLGLFEDGTLTELGQRVVDETLRRVVRRTPDGAAVFWGYTSELAKVRITPTKLDPSDSDASPRESWDLLAALHAAYAASGKSAKRKQSADDLISFLKEVFTLYRQARKDKSLIRNTLPLYVAEPVLAAWCAVQRRPLPPLRDILDTEFRKPKRRVQSMLIRGTSGSLYFMR